MLMKRGKPVKKLTRLCFPCTNLKKTWLIIGGRLARCMLLEKNSRKLSLLLLFTLLGNSIPKVRSQESDCYLPKELPVPVICYEDENGGYLAAKELEIEA
ncbi:hypothetical protein PIB30_088264 [Stylosanthes scabra]|uniref:Uncharacterized protein n=1 Tax=Stylosanthes scabra TaxID=79078 RepID=A0ABU6YRA6_9FABA|nr:hypothetical protein [Stylosanthes scabra]